MLASRNFTKLEIRNFTFAHLKALIFKTDYEHEPAQSSSLKKINLRSFSVDVVATRRKSSHDTLKLVRKCLNLNVYFFSSL